MYKMKRQRIEFELMDWEGGCDVSNGKWRLAYHQWQISLGEQRFDERRCMRKLLNSCAYISSWCSHQHNSTGADIRPGKAEGIKSNASRFTRHQIAPWTALLGKHMTLVTTHVCVRLSSPTSQPG